MHSLALLCYEYSEGIEKNLEKAFYWHKMTSDNFKLTTYVRNAINHILITNGANNVILNNFNGPIDSLNFDEQQWNRWTEYEVIIKNLNNSSSLSDKFLDERGLKVIHESELTHCDFHDGNILISDDYNEIYIIDLGLCKPIQNSDDKIDKVYGIIPYMAPEILRNNPYTPASDIYSFSMMMWEFTSGIPPFNNKAHDVELILSICEGDRPVIIKNTPKCYEKMLGFRPFQKTNIVIIENTISEWLRCVNEYYKLNGEDEPRYEVPNIDNQLKNDMYEFIKANSVLTLEQDNISVLQTHPQAYYTSRLLTEILYQNNSECLDCII
ncbi:kinase-like domain-containing protein [Rhizophagus irregularis DAOM 181602=DAOM 197198]|nr:kinase-like domain-containing protein [Rhizophagus irregularis DAOM 181602=DAOM 197198]